ncbi:MAG TPA: hypothetical protein VFX15_06250 [Actinomycetes bacterium]|nr:hypothetical protein [Actinomycetes bacterium]
MLAALNVLEALSVSAADDPADSKIGPGLLAFVVVAFLAVATFLLIRSMLHHLRKVPPAFEDKEPQNPQTDTPAGPSGSPRDGDESGPGVG